MLHLHGNHTFQLTWKGLASVLRRWVPLLECTWRGNITASFGVSGCLGRMVHLAHCHIQSLYNHHKSMAHIASSNTLPKSVCTWSCWRNWIILALLHEWGVEWKINTVLRCWKVKLSIYQSIYLQPWAPASDQKNKITETSSRCEFHLKCVWAQP